MSGEQKVQTVNQFDRLDHGSTSVGVTAVQVTATSELAHKGLLIKADNANTGTIYMGNSDVTANTTAATDGFQLGPGESVELEVEDPSIVYARASAASQKVFWIFV